MDDEAYEYGQRGDLTGLSRRIPPWLKALEYTTHATGICAIANMSDILSIDTLKRYPALVKSYAVINLFSCDPDEGYKYMRKLTRMQVYMLFKGSSIHLTLLSGAYMQDAQGAWELHTAVELRNPDNLNHDDQVLKIVKFITITYATSTSEPPELPAFPIRLICPVTGDPEFISDAMNSPPLVIPTVEQSASQTDTGSERLSAFFGISRRKSKTDSKPPSHVLKEQASESETRDNLFKTLSYYNKKKEKQPT